MLVIPPGPGRLPTPRCRVAVKIGPSPSPGRATEVKDFHVAPSGAPAGCAPSRAINVSVPPPGCHQRVSLLALSTAPPLAVARNATLASVLECTGSRNALNVTPAPRLEMRSPV